MMQSQAYMHGHDACPDEHVAATCSDIDQPQQQHTQQEVGHHAGPEPQLQHTLPHQ